MSLLRRVIGGVLRRVRLRQRRTLRDVAEAAGVSVPYLSEVERGRKEASSEVLAAICRALGIHLSDLLELARDDMRRLEPRLPVRPRSPQSRAGSHPTRSGRASSRPTVGRGRRPVACRQPRLTDLRRVLGRQRSLLLSADLLQAEILAGSLVPA